MGRCLRLLGVPREDIAGEPGDLPLDKPASLLYYLAQRGDWVGRSELAFLYRPDAPERIALSNVRVLLYRAKERPWAEGLEVEKFRVRYRVDTDVQVFFAALEQRAWARALDLYRGPFLTGIQVADAPGYDTWLELERQDLHQKWRFAALHHVQTLEERRDFAAAGAWLEQLRNVDPLDEEVLQVYLRVLLAAGKRSRALDVFEAFRVELKRELDVEPLESTRAVLETLSRGDAITLESPSGPRHNLPAQTTRFVGRKRELERLSQTLAKPDCRLLTLVGLGGVGKTRLALETAALRLEAFADGVWFVPLAGVGSPELLVPSIAGAVQLRFSGARDPKAQLEDFLRDKELLLLLDNFEHLVEGAVVLDSLLATASRLKILVTSRLALELSAEWLFDLEGLAYPPVASREPLASFDAVKLFSHRAERLSMTFVAEGRTLEAIAALCRKVEGLPLALELAATWTRSLSVPQLLSELESNFDLLAGQQRDLPERHRSVRTVFDYSWQRLSEPEREALVRLSMFHGGFTLEAAEQVAGVHLALLLSLINHALVRRGREGRYLLHELVRQYALTALDGRGRSELEADYCRYYLGLLERSANDLLGPRQQAAKETLTSDIDNLRSAYTVALAKEVWGLLDGALRGLATFFLRTSLFEEGRGSLLRLIASLEAADGAALPVVERLTVRARLWLGLLLRNIGLFQEAKAHLEEAAVGLRALGIKDELASALHELGHVARRTGELDRAEAYLDEGMALCDELEDDVVRAETLHHQALLRRDQGRLAAAKELLEDRLRLCERLGDVTSIASTTSQLAIVALQSGGGTAEPKRYLQQALESFRHLGDKDQETIALYNLGRIAYAEGGVEESEAILLDCLRIRQHLGILNIQERIYSTLGELMRDQERFEEASGYARRSLEVSARLHLPEGQALALADLGEIARRRGDDSDARTYLREALQLLGSADIPLLIALEILYLLALHLEDRSKEESFLLTEFVAAHDSLTRRVRTLVAAASERLASELPPSTVERLGAEAASLSLEELLARQRALLAGES